MFDIYGSDDTEAMDSTPNGISEIFSRMEKIEAKIRKVRKKKKKSAGDGKKKLKKTTAGLRARTRKVKVGS
jgi:hypothetical protein